MKRDVFLTKMKNSCQKVILEAVLNLLNKFIKHDLAACHLQHCFG
jgi:hypothetical protein